MKAPECPSNRSSLRAIRGISADWVARCNGRLSAEEAAELRSWLEADARHAAGFAEAEAMWMTLNRPRRAGSARSVLQALAADEGRRRHRRKISGFAALTCAAAAVFLFAGFPLGSRPAAPASPTVAFSPDRQLLPDGSVADLNAGAEIAVEYSAELRRIRLLKGEVLFSVAGNPSRPFVVSAGHIEVRAIGTAFSVRSDPSGIDVLVTHGRVAVEQVVASPDGSGSSPQGSPPLELTAGRHVAIPVYPVAISAWKVSLLGTTEIRAVLAWREKRFEFTRTPLREALDLFNRENLLQLSLGDPSLEDRRITGVFLSDDPEGFVRLLETGLRVTTERHGDHIRLRDK